jgi:hypothetical protein
MNIYGIIFSATDLWLLGICGTLCMAWLGFKIKSTLNRHNAFRNATITFNTKILTELEGLYPIPSNWPDDKMMIDKILRNKFPKLQSAVAEFKKFLPWYRRKSFDRAWFIYRMGEDGREIDKQDYWQYIPHSGTSVVNGNKVTNDTTKTYQENFKSNVDSLLKFAKIT